MKSVLVCLGTNIYIIGLCSAITIIGFVITVIIFFRTKSIEKRIKEYKSKTNYNKRRKEFRSALLQFKKSIEEDNSDIKKNKGSILNELNALFENYKLEFNFRQKITINCLIRHLEKFDKHDRNFVCNNLSRVAGFLFEEKESIL
jgi:hypothetical protein